MTVTWMKYCRQMLLLTGDSVYADQIERSLYNALLGAVNTEGHVCRGQVFPFDSYSPLLNGHRGRAVGGYKDILKDRFWWGCCVAIGAAGTALPGMTAVQRARDGAVVNLYLPGTARVPLPDGGEEMLRIETAYPADGRVTVTAENAGHYALYLRIPAWSEKTELQVCGEAVEAVPGGYARVERDWKPGDSAVLPLDMRVRVIRAAEIDPDADAASICHAALQRGPVMLARDARFGEDVTEAVTLADADGFAEAEPVQADFPVRQAYRVKTAEGSVGVADYASCGQDWDEALPMTVWITTK